MGSPALFSVHERFTAVRLWNNCSSSLSSSISTCPCDCPWLHMTPMPQHMSIPALSSLWRPLSWRHPFQPIFPEGTTEVICKDEQPQGLGQCLSRVQKKLSTDGGWLRADMSSIGPSPVERAWLRPRALGSTPLPGSWVPGSWQSPQAPFWKVIRTKWGSTWERAHHTHR